MESAVRVEIQFPRSGQELTVSVPRTLAEEAARSRIARDLTRADHGASVGGGSSSASSSAKHWS